MQILQTLGAALLPKPSTVSCRAPHTGQGAAQDIKLIANYVVGICVKDCTGREGEVMITVGEGLVDFGSVFGTLKDAGFTGSVTVECLGGETPEQVDVAAQQTYEFADSLLS